MKGAAMVALRPQIVVLTCLFATLHATRTEAQRVAPPWTEPQAMFEALFGKEGEVDEKVLAEITVSAREERQMGKRAVDAYLGQLKAQRVRVVQRGKDVAYLKALIRKVQPMMTQRERYSEIKIYLALSDHCDARCFPGGYLVFFQGLLDSAENEAALIGMVGHELSHLDRGHQTRRIKQMKLAERTFSGGVRPMKPSDFFTVGGVMMRAWLRPFRPDYEREADLDGARWSYQAGYDCRETGKLFLRHQERNGNVNLPIPEFFRSHPAGADRHRAIVNEYERLQAESPKDDLVIGEENLLARVVALPNP
jgi:predicted Zn-dependent protease